MDDIDAEWYDICDGIRASGLVTWDDWVDQGRQEPKML